MKTKPSKKIQMKEKSGGSFGEGLGCATMILAAGVVLALLMWAGRDFPQFWK